jgi:hypothetical protein
VPATQQEGDRTVLPDRHNPAARSPLIVLHRGTPGPDVLKGAQPVQQAMTRPGRPVEVWQTRPQSAVTPDQAYWVVYKAGSWTVLAPAADLEVATDVARQLEARQASDGFVVVDANAPLALSHEFGQGGGVQLAIGDRNPRPDQVDAGKRFRLRQRSRIHVAAAEAGHPPGLLVDRFGGTVGRGGVGPGTPLTPGRHRAGSQICWHGTRTWTPRYRGATRQFVPQAPVLPLELGHLGGQVLFGPA